MELPNDVLEYLQNSTSKRAADLLEKYAADPGRLVIPEGWKVYTFAELLESDGMVFDPRYVDAPWGVTEKIGSLINSRPDAFLTVGKRWGSQ